MIRGVAFDLEGTVVNVEEVHFEAFARAARDLGLNVTPAQIRRQIPNAVGGGNLLVAGGIACLLGDSARAEEVLGKKLFHYYNLLGQAEVALRPGFAEFVSVIQQSGLPMAVGSMTPIHQAGVLIERTGLDEFFSPDQIVLAEDVECLKPAPDVYLETARRMGIVPSEQLVFEDSATGVLAAVRAGSRVISVPVYHDPLNLESIAKAGADAIFPGWEAVLGARPDILQDLYFTAPLQRSPEGS